MRREDTAARAASDTVDLVADLDAAPDPAFLAAFEAQRIAHTEWTHRSHVRMAYLYVGGEAGVRRAGPLAAAGGRRVTSVRRGAAGCR